MVSACRRWRKRLSSCVPYAQPSDTLPQGNWTPEGVLEGIRRHAEAGHDLAAHRMQAIDGKPVAAGGGKAFSNGSGSRP